MKNEEYLSEREIQLELLKEVKDIKLEIKKPSKQVVHDLGFIDTADAMQLLKISLKSLYNLRRKGILRSGRLGGKLYFKLSDIKERLEEQFQRQ